MNVSLAPQEATIVETDVPGAAGTHATATSGGTVQYTRDGQLVLQATQVGSYSVPLSNGKTASVSVSSIPAAADLSSGWSLTLSSWGPDPAADASNPEISEVTTTTFPANALGAWSSLPATSSQLSVLGVTSMSQVSGTGEYANTFQLPASWKTGTNTIQVKVDTNLGNRVGRTTQSYGLTGVTFTPYTDVSVR